MDGTATTAFVTPERSGPAAVRARPRPASRGWAAKELLVSDASRATLLGSFWVRDARQGTPEYAGVDYGLEQPYDLVAPARVAASGWSGRQLPGIVPAGDLDADERLDLVTADRWGRLAVRAAGADGTPGAPTAVAGSVPAGTRLFRARCDGRAAAGGGGPFRVLRT
ncbi:hypothetical protein ABZ618_09070 [Streptomyces roseolus]|uniref:hypothetical protein n=1 Tax=Streptomyces roseolus TaxID=67358 RepID=UPI0033F9EE44